MIKPNRYWRRKTREWGNGYTQKIQQIFTMSWYDWASSLPGQSTKREGEREKSGEEKGEEGKRKEKRGGEWKGRKEKEGVNEKEKKKEEIREEILVSKYFLLLKRTKAF